MTTVIHCKFAAGVPAVDYVYCGRPSKWGNPFSYHKGTPPAWRVANRQEAIERFASWFYAMEQAQLRHEALVELKDKVLGCWCKPRPCHVDILAEFVNRAS